MRGLLRSGMVLLCGAWLLSGCDDSGHDRAPASALASGALDPAFGSGGVLLPDLGTSVGGAYAIAVEAPWMYVGGNDTAAGMGEWRIEKRKLSDGTLDPGFGTGGVVVFDPTPDGDAITCLVLSGGSLYVAGMQGSGDWVWRIEKRSAADGSLDAVFGSGTGAVTTNPSSGPDFPSALVVEGNDLFIAGTQVDKPGVQGQWVIQKRNATSGDLSSSFAMGTEFMPSDPGPAVDEVRAMVADAASLYIVGLQHLSGGDYCWRIEKRDRATGSLDGAFGAGTGAYTINPSTDTYEEASRIILLGSSLYIAGFQRQVTPYGDGWRIEKRDKGSGELDAVFGNGTGVVIANLGLVGSQADGGLATDGTSLFVAGSVAEPSVINNSLRIEKRDLVTGALVPSFGSGGAVTSNPTHIQESFQGIVVDGSFLYAAGYQGGGKWRLEKRAK